MSWTLKAKKIKNYPHFDAPISMKNAAVLANDPDAVAANTFYPFLRYDQSWQPFRDKNGIDEKPKKKSRPISYCARRDAYIFMRYRELLSLKYEAKLREYAIEEAPIAYRKILKTPNATIGKCNIDFAKEVIDEVKKVKNCKVVALDIKGFFDNLDHSKIYEIWCNLLGVQELPADHKAVFKAVTQFRFVDTREAYRRLGFFGEKNVGDNVREGFLRQKSEIPKQLCSSAEFRTKILGKNSQHKSLVRKNWKSRGIPQGSPISDIIANFYLIDFDRKMSRFAKRHGGSYRRYSDDILLLLPSDSIEVSEAEKFANEQICAQGSHLVIKKSKTSVIEFRAIGERLIFCHQSGEQGANGLEYLGFRFDGAEVFLRDSTVSRYYRKIAVAAGAEAHYLASKYPGMDIEFLMSMLNMSVLLQRWDRVMKFRVVRHDPKKWTFRTYAKRAADTFQNGDVFLRQIGNTKAHLRSRVRKHLMGIIK